MKLKLKLVALLNYWRSWKPIVEAKVRYQSTLFRNNCKENWSKTTTPNLELGIHLICIAMDRIKWYEFELTG